MNQILPELFDENQLIRTKNQPKPEMNKYCQQSPFSAHGTRKISVNDIFVVEVDNGTILDINEYRKFIQ